MLYSYLHDRRLRSLRWRGHRPWSPNPCAGLSGAGARIAARAHPETGARCPARVARQRLPPPTGTAVSAASSQQGPCPHATNVPQGLGTAVYRRRDPATTVLYQVVQQNLETFLALSAGGGPAEGDPMGEWLPGFVERDLRLRQEVALKSCSHQGWSGTTGSTR